jgi:RNA polymerase sigma factor (sigma-70 family)
VIYRVWRYRNDADTAPIHEGEADVETKRTSTLVASASDPNATLTEQHDAFGELVNLYQDMAVGFARAVLGDTHLAEEAAQRAFITAWHKLDQLREPDAFAGWLKRILVTECNRLTRGKRLRATSLNEAADVPADTPCPHVALEAEEVRRAVASAVEGLPATERTVVALFYGQGRSHADISTFLGVPATTVAKRLHSARKRMREPLADALGIALAGCRPSRDERFAERVRAGTYDAYLGSYRFEDRPELTVVVRREGAALVSEAAGQRNVLFAQCASGAELRTREFDGRGKFVRDRRGRVTGFVYYELGREMGLAKKIGLGSSG